MDRQTNRQIKVNSNCLVSSILQNILLFILVAVVCIPVLLVYSRLAFIIEALLPSLLSQGGHALRAGPAQSLSPLVASPEGEYSGPLPPPGPPLDVLGSQRGIEDHPPPSTSHSSPPFRDKSCLAEFVPMLTQGWAEIFIRRPSGTTGAGNNECVLYPVTLARDVIITHSICYDTFVYSIKIKSSQLLSKGVSAAHERTCGPQGLSCHFDSFIIA